MSKDSTVAESSAALPPALGFSIGQAESIEAAVSLLESCPMSMWVYEAMPMYDGPRRVVRGRHRPLRERLAPGDRLATGPSSCHTKEQAGRAHPR